MSSAPRRGAPGRPSAGGTDPSTDAARSPAGLDPDRFASLRADFSAAEFAELLATFHTLTAPLIDEIAEAVSEGDDERARVAAHRLRGGCLSLGAMTLAATAAQLERRDFSDCSAEERAWLVRAIERQWGELQAALRPAC